MDEELNVSTQNSTLVWRQHSVSESEAAKTYEEVTYKIIGAAMQVHSALGPGLKEAIYQRALSAAMEKAGLSFEEERPFQVTLDETQIGLLYLDHLVEGAVVVEEKAFTHLLTDEEAAQVIPYLAVMEAPVGLLLNFGCRRLQYKRILPPKQIAEWQAKTIRYAWRPPDS